MSPATEGPTTGGSTALTVADLNTEVNCEARILDTRLAEALGFATPAKIRPLIRRHLDLLRQRGAISATAAENTGRGRPGKAFWLNRKQALLICMKSETPQADEITMQVIDVYDEVTGGGAVAPPAQSIVPRPQPPEIPEPRSGEPGDGILVIDGTPIRFNAGRRPKAGDLGVFISRDGVPFVHAMPAGEDGRTRLVRIARDTATLLGAVTSGPVRGKRPALPSPGGISERLLRTYASWLHMEYGRLQEEIEQAQGHKSRLSFGLEITNPGYFYHMPRSGEVLAPPSSRALTVLKAVGCPVPVPQPQRLLPKR